MANFKQLLINVPLTLALIFCLNVNSLPNDNTVVEVAHTNETVALVKMIECIINDNCGSHGHCTNESVCACDAGWATYVNATNDTSFCGYEQRSKRTAFFVSFFAGYTGADWFYLSRGKAAYIIAGVVKVLLVFACGSAWPLTYFGFDPKKSDSIRSRLSAVSTFFTLVAFAWWLVDWARVLGNRFPDGNGLALTRW